MEEVQEHKRVHFASSCNEKERAEPPRSPEGWKIGAIFDVPSDATTPPPSTGASVLSDVTPASAKWLESARKVDDLRSRLESLEQALQEMEVKAVEQLDKALQEKVLATALKLVERRFNDQELNSRIQEQVLATAMKLCKHGGTEENNVSAGGEDCGDLCRKLDLDSATVVEEYVAAAPETMLEQFAAHIEIGLGEVVRRLERKVDALQYLVDNNIFAALEERVTEVVSSLDQRVTALEERKAAGEAPSGCTSDDSSTSMRLAALEAETQEQHATILRLLNKAGIKVTYEATEPSGTASQLDDKGISPALQTDPATVSGQDKALSASDGPAPGRQLQQRSPAAKLASTSGAGAALQGALHTAKARVAATQAAAGAKAASKWSWWMAALHVLGWTFLVAMGLAACLVGMLSVLVAGGHINAQEYLS